jgi:transposase
LHGWAVEITDAVKVKGFAPLACQTDKIDAWVLAELSRRDLVPAIWLSTPGIRAERERARWRLHLVRHRTALKNRIHATLLAFGHPCPVSELFGAAGRRLLDSLELPEPWATDVAAALRLIDDLDGEIADCEAVLRRLGAEHASVPLLLTAPGIGWVLGYTIAAEIGDITRFPTPKKLVGSTGLCPAVAQSGGHDWRGELAKNGPKYLRWALIEAATPRRPPPGLRRPLPAHQDPSRQAARREGRPGRHRPPARRGHLVDAHHEQALRSGRRHNHRSGRIDGPSLRCATGAKPLPSGLVLPPGGDGEMSPAPYRPERSPPRAASGPRPCSAAQRCCRRFVPRPGRSSSPLRGCGRSTRTRSSPPAINPCREQERMDQDPA